MSGSGLAVGVLGLLFFCIVAMGPVMMFVVRRNSAWGICRRLQGGRRVITCRTTYGAGAWNPARPLGSGNRTPNEPGSASYSLTSEGLIRLDLVRADGRREAFVGPPVEQPDGFGYTRRVAAIPALVYLASAGIGFAFGFTLTSNRDDGSRVQNGIVAAICGWVAGWLGLIIALAVARARQQRAR